MVRKQHRQRNSSGCSGRDPRVSMELSTVVQINHAVLEINRFDPIEVPINDALVDKASSTCCLSRHLACFIDLWS